jgi:hypothetical protein
VKVNAVEALSERARVALWQRGNLRYQLHSTQLKILDALESNKSRKFYILCSRRLGKTYLLVNRAVQLCLRKAGSRVLYLAPYAKDAQEISTDTLAKVLEHCPDEMKPEWSEKTKELRFKNGSLIRVKGVNGEHAQFLRGGSADLIILDECGIMDDLEHVLQDVCMPMTLTTGGSILMATTPPRSPGHESARQYELLAAKGSTVTFTLRDAPHVTDDTKIEFLVEAGESEAHATACISSDAWPLTTTARREYFCEFVTDANSAVVPEFTNELAKKIVIDWPTPEYYDRYVSMDPGMRDRTGILFGYWDFANAKLVIQDEALLDQANTQDIANCIKTKEAALWGMAPPMLRVSDVDLRLVADLYQMHRLTFVSARKEDSLGAINLLRNMIQNNIIISPRCVNLKRQLKNAVWNNKATDFDHGNKEDGHYDLVAALKYMCRSVVRDKNPYPAWYALPGGPGGPKGYVGHRWYAAHRKAKGNGLFNDTPLARRLKKSGF